MRIFITFILIVIFNGQLEAQLDPRRGYDLFKSLNYIDALPELKKHIKVDPKDNKALYHIGLCYLNTGDNKGASIKYLEKVIETGKAYKETGYYLAQGYMHNYDFAKAESTINLYIESPGKFEEEAKVLLANIPLAKKLHDNPIHVEFTNLGDKINGPFPDYAPFVSEDEEILVFTSRREEGKGQKEFDGYYPSDIFSCKFNGSAFSPAKATGVNTNFDETCVGIKTDGSGIFIYIDNINEVGEIYEADRTGSTYNKKRKIKEGINDLKTMETSGSISPDGNFLFFASNREGDKGGLDLYMTAKLPNGSWAQPQPLSQLNTIGHEDFPSLSADGKTLYFCSNGRGGMGGYDLFKVDFNFADRTFGEVKNLGFPINTSYDDKVICFAKNAKHAYVSQYRKDEGLGDLDIYRVNFKEVNLNPALYIVSLKDAIKTENVENVTIYVYNESDENIGEFKSIGVNNIIMTLKPGKYSLEIEATGYTAKVIELKVSEFDYKEGMIKLSYSLAK
jgi:tetratricopeptide (TPR) repeat protein